ncbi:MAG: cation transporter [Eubacteriales bacterium]
MFGLLSKIFIKNRDDLKNPAVRRAYGILSGTLGIVLNILLFAGKLTAGLISGSVAIVADALNNLSDAGSSVITLIGFRMAGQKPDKGHPFGHGRIEYIRADRFNADNPYGL